MANVFLNLKYGRFLRDFCTHIQEENSKVSYSMLKHINVHKPYEKKIQNSYSFILLLEGIQFFGNMNWVNLLQWTYNLCTVGV